MRNDRFPEQNLEKSAIRYTAWFFRDEETYLSANKTIQQLYLFRV